MRLSIIRRRLLLRRLLEKGCSVRLRRIVERNWNLTTSLAPLVKQDERGVPCER